MPLRDRSRSVFVTLRPRGYVLGGSVLVTATTMGLALMAMTVFALRAGLQVKTALSAAWITLAVTGVVISFWFSRACRAEEWRHAS